MSGRYADAFGDPAYLDGALGRLETGQPLRAVDVQELSYAIGRDAALKLAAVASAPGGRRSRRSGVWGWWFGPVQTGREVPVPVLRLVARIRSGEAVSARDVRSVARQVGRAGARAVSRRASRTARSALRGLTRASSRRASRTASSSASRRTSSVASSRTASRAASRTASGRGWSR